MNVDVTAVMDSLRIDDGIRPLIQKLWAHGYQTLRSCSGHGVQKATVLLNGGDGYFEKHSDEFGLTLQDNDLCCATMVALYLADVTKYNLDPATHPDQSKCCIDCGAGINGNKQYRGWLQTPLD